MGYVGNCLNFGESVNRASRRSVRSCAQERRSQLPRGPSLDYRAKSGCPPRGAKGDEPSQADGLKVGPRSAGFLAISIKWRVSDGPTDRSESSRIGQLKLVAGRGFEPLTFGL